MSWPNENTPQFYVHDRTCAHCGNTFPGFPRSRYCSPHCIEMFKRAKTMTEWGVPTNIINQLLTQWKVPI